MSQKVLEIVNLTGGLVTQIPPERIEDNQFQDIVNFLTDDQLAPTKQGGRSKANSTEVGSSQKPRGMHVHVRQDGTVYIYMAINSKIYQSSNGGSTFTAMQFAGDATDITIDTSSNDYNYDFVSYDNYVYMIGPVYPIVTNTDAANHTHATISRALRLDGITAKLIYWDNTGAMTAGSSELEVGASGSEEPWPRAGRFMTVHQRRIHIFNYYDSTGAAAPRAGAWCETDNPLDWTPAAGNNYTVNTVNELYTGAISYGSFILGHTKNSIQRWETSGEKEGWSIITYERRNGTVGHWTQKVMPDGFVWYLSWDGEYRTNGFITERVSDAIKSSLRSLPQQSDPGTTLQSSSKTSQADWELAVASQSLNTSLTAGTMYLGVGDGDNSDNTEMTNLPSVDGWTFGSSEAGSVEADWFGVSGGILTSVATAYTVSKVGLYYKTISGLSIATGFLMEVRAKFVSGSGTNLIVGLSSSTANSYAGTTPRIYLTATTVILQYGTNTLSTTITTTDYHIYNMVVQGSNAYLFIDNVYYGTVAASGTPDTTVYAKILVGGTDVASVDYVRFDNDIASIATPALYNSDTINLGAGTLVSWGTFQCTYNANGQPVTFEIEARAADSGWGSWTTLTPGAVPTVTIQQYVRIRIRRTDTATLPTNHIEVTDLTVNYNVVAYVQAPCAEVFDDRYVLSYAGSGSLVNDRSLIYGKSGWVKNDQMACSRFGIYNNLLIGASASAGFLRYELSGTQADGSNFTAYFVTKAYYVGSKVEEETDWDSFYVLSRADANYTFKYAVRSREGSWGSYQSATITATSSLSLSDKITVPASARPLKGEWIRFRIEVDSADSNFYFGGIIGYGKKGNRPKG